MSFRFLDVQRSLCVNIMAAAQHIAKVPSRVLAEPYASACLSASQYDIFNTSMTSPELGDDACFFGKIDLKIPHNECEAVSRVLNTIELLEEILANLPPDQLFRIERTCKAFQAAINGCPGIRRHLFREADHKCAFTFIPVKFCGMRIHQTSSDLYGYSSWLWLDETSYDRLRSYAGLRNLLLAQPPPLHAKIHAESVDSVRRYQLMGYSTTCSNHTGITTGDVLETVGNLSERHRSYNNMAWPKC